jgi:hypothetical protein
MQLDMKRDLKQEHLIQRQTLQRKQLQEQHELNIHLVTQQSQ